MGCRNRYVLGSGRVSGGDWIALLECVGFGGDDMCDDFFFFGRYPRDLCSFIGGV